MKKVVSVTLNEDGTIKGLLFEGNKSATPMKTVIRMLTDGKELDLSETDLEVVNRASGPYVRKKANETTEDNLGKLADAVVAEKAAKDAAWEDVKVIESVSPGILARLVAWLKG
jgi:hypothetical protein